MHNLTVHDVLQDTSKELYNIFNAESDEDELTTQTVPSQYYTESELNNYFKQTHVSDLSHLKIMSLNIANILSKKTSLRTMIENISNDCNQPNILTITETHLHEKRSQGYTQTELENILPGYKFFHRDRSEKKGGGVGVFVEERLAGNAEIIRDNIFYKEEVFESILLKIPAFPFRSAKKNLLILTVYRQPGNEHIHTFFDILEAWLDTYDKRSNEIVITGDLNLDLLKYQSHEKTTQYLDLMLSHTLSPMITKPTRIKHTSATLIDHIFTKITDSHGGILLTELSGSHGFTDHYPVFVVIEKGKSEKKTNKTTTRRYFTRQGHKTRRDGLKKENWEDLYQETDPNVIYEEFQARYIKHYEAGLTTKTTNVNGSKVPKQPWMTHGILKKIRKRDRLAKIKNRREDYKHLRNEIVRDCRKAERDYIRRKIQDNSEDAKEHWKILNQVMGKTNNKLDMPTAFMNNDRWETDMERNAQNFNQFYSNVGPDTSKSVGNSNKPAEFFLHRAKERNEEELLYTRFTVEETIEASRLINNKTSCDAYGLSQAIVLKDVDIIAPVIAYIANCSIEQGICPDLTKVARVIPIYKEKGENYLYTNYRPISLIPVFSKIMEKLIYKKIFDFLVRYKILFKSQYGFRAGNSTIHATLDFIQTIHKAMSEQEYAIGIFCDLSKAFDTLDHSILLTKLDHYGIRGNWLSWFKSYLSNRRQYVDINGIKSGYENITVGVPQGSILGPLLFLIYINDLPGSLEKLISVLFADDSNLVIKGENLKELVSTINTELKCLSDFFKANKLKLNASKTKVVCFRKKSQPYDSKDIQIEFDGTLLVPEEHATFLGVDLDANLNWEKHCTKVANKMARNSGILNRVKRCIPLSSMKTLYNSLIFTHYSYCLEAWGSCQQRYLKRIKTIQKKAVRAVCKSNWHSHTEPRMKDMRVLKFEDQHEFQCLTLMFKMINGLCPDICNFTQDLKGNRSERTLRSDTTQPINLRVPSLRATQGLSPFESTSPSLWNELPTTLQKEPSCSAFKNKLKNTYLTQYAKKVKCNNSRCFDRRYHT